MNDNDSTKQKQANKPAKLFALKLRVWLIRRLSGKHDFDKLTERRDKHIMHTAVDVMHTKLKDYINETMHASITKMPQNLLAAVIASNVHLTEIQKAQIASILDTQAQTDNSRFYLQ